MQSIPRRTSIRELGLPVAAEAREFTVEGVVQALTALAQRPS
jgi:hypothetical protein